MISQSFFFAWKQNWILEVINHFEALFHDFKSRMFIRKRQLVAFVHVLFILEKKVNQLRLDTSPDFFDFFTWKRRRIWSNCLLGTIFRYRLEQIHIMEMKYWASIKQFYQMSLEAKQRKRPYAHCLKCLLFLAYSNSDNSMISLSTIETLEIVMIQILSHSLQRAMTSYSHFDAIWRKLFSVYDCNCFSSSN